MWSISTTTPILPHILPQILPQTTTTIATHPPMKYSVPKINTGKCFDRPAKILRGLQRFGDNLGAGGAGAGGAGAGVLTIWF